MPLIYCYKTLCKLNFYYFHNAWNEWKRLYFFFIFLYISILKKLDAFLLGVFQEGVFSAFHKNTNSVRFLTSTYLILQSHCTISYIVGWEYFFSGFNLSFTPFLVNLWYFLNIHKMEFIVKSWYNAINL